MIEKFTQIAPLSSWAMLAAATVMLVGGFLAFSHAQLAWRAFGERWSGPAGSGTVSTMARWTISLIAGGVLLWGVLLGWSTLSLVLIGAVATVAVVLEAAVRLLE